MIGKRNTGILHYSTVFLAALLICGCANKSQAPATAAGDEPTVTAPAATSPAGIMALGSDLRAHPRAVFSSTSAKYGYFIGGVLDAEFEPTTRVLSLTSQGSSPEVNCKYAADGALFIEDGEDADAKRANCDALALKLRESLAR